MFQLDYRIVHSEYDDFAGENGFILIYGPTNIHCQQQESIK